MSVNNEHFIPLSIITFPSISNIVIDSYKHIIIVWHIIMTNEVSTKIEILCKKRLSTWICDLKSYQYISQSRKPGLALTVTYILLLRNKC